MERPGAAARAPLGARLWTYQRERFPVFKNGLLIAAFGASAVCLSALLRAPGARPAPLAIAVSILVLFILFFQLRVADEHKDAAEDLAFRPERPVPRGLVTLKELRALAYGGAAVQALLVVLLDPALLALLCLVWAWMALMTAEFFVPVWLKARPVLYMVSHMAIMPLIDLFATACDWFVAGAQPGTIQPGSILPSSILPGGIQSIGAHSIDPHLTGAFTIGLGAFLALSFTNGMCLEVARKSWAPEDEREGVETYSKLWGAKTAGLTAAGAMMVALALASVAHVASGAAPWFGVGLAIFAMAGALCAFAYVLAPTRAAAARLETASGLWVLASYGLLGVAPMGMRAWTG